ncbi:MAG TPA: hypothetical protein VK465_13815 [Fibrobacteria bacterium]|nr:hypothetical protein [Fibrobacteria bacterium]
MEKQTPVMDGRIMSQGLGNLSRVRKEIRSCKHPGCNKKFEGSPTSLYCMDHRTRKSRAERFVPKEMPKPEDTNLVIEADINSPVQKTLLCSLPGCCRDYTFTLYPDHTIYPMYCELHRTEFKRRYFLRMQATGRMPDDRLPQYEKWTDYEMQFEEYALSQPHIIPFPPKKPRGVVN